MCTIIWEENSSENLLDIVTIKYPTLIFGKKFLLKLLLNILILHVLEKCEI